MAEISSTSEQRSDHRSARTTPLPNRDVTIAITLRLSKRWLRKLEKLARNQACRHNIRINHCDLIREAIYSTYIDPEADSPFKKNCDVCKERLRYQTFSKLLYSSMTSLEKLDDRNAQGIGNL
jgi:hypothetical protein